MTTLYQGFKNILKYVLPMPARSQNREFNSIRANIQKQENKLQQTVSQLEEKQEAMTASLLEVLNKLQNRLESQQKAEELLKKNCSNWRITWIT